MSDVYISKSVGEIENTALRDTSFKLAMLLTFFERTFVYLAASN